MKKVTVNYYGVEIELDGYYTQGEERTYNYPGSGSTYEIYNALVNGVDIVEMLLEKQLDDLQELAVEEIEN